MFDALVSFLKSLFAEPQHQELLIPVRVDEKRDQLRRRR
jgi:hypothetical protein